MQVLQFITTASPSLYRFHKITVRIFSLSAISLFLGFTSCCEVFTTKQIIFVSFFSGCEDVERSVDSYFRAHLWPHHISARRPLQNQPHVSCYELFWIISSLLRRLKRLLNLDNDQHDLSFVSQEYGSAGIIDNRLTKCPCTPIKMWFTKIHI